MYDFYSGFNLAFCLILYQKQISNWEIQIICLIKYTFLLFYMG